MLLTSAKRLVFLSRHRWQRSRVLRSCPARINVGCGYDKKPGYLNIDVDPACKPDVLIRNDDYSVIPHRHFDEVFAKDVLEHIPRPAVLSALLDWASWLKPNGKLFLHTSSILGVADQLRTATTFAEQNLWTTCLFGNQVHHGDFHHVGFTELTLKVHMLAAGFEIDTIQIEDRWMFRVHAHKANGWDDFVADSDGLDDAAFVDELHRRAVGREPKPDTRAYLLYQLHIRRMTRQQAAKHLFETSERLFYTADQAGL